MNGDNLDDNLEEMDRIIQAARDVVLDIIHRYDIENYDEFSCPKMKKLAEECKILG